MSYLSSYSSFFFFNDTATTEIYTLSLHDALPILMAFNQPANVTLVGTRFCFSRRVDHCFFFTKSDRAPARDRKSTRLNSSHLVISYAVFCLKKKKKEH